MRDALICEPLRTPVGRFGGMFRAVSVTDLATTVIKAVVVRTGVAPESVDDVLLGQAYANGEAPALGGSPPSTPVCPSMCPDCRSTAAAARGCRP